MTDSPNWSFETKQIHAGQSADAATGARALPIYQTTSYVFTSTDHAANLFGLKEFGNIYTRLMNPTTDVVEQRLAALEGGVGALLVASGQAAETLAILNIAEAGDHVVASPSLYGGTYNLLKNTLTRFGLEVSFVEDPASIDSWRAAIRPNTKLLFGETIANPKSEILDIEAVAALAHEHGVPLVVDNTVATPFLIRPIEWGADVVVHSATKYVGGHSDVTGGIAVGDVELLARVRAARVNLGGSLAPDEAFLLHRGLATLPLRVARQCATALTVARALADHPGVERIDYPGLPSHPQHELAEKLFDKGPEGRRFGAIVTVTPHGGRAGGMRVADALRVGVVATSLGGTHTVVSHVASTTHRQFDDAALLAGGIAPAALRISIGLEDAEDLIEDIRRALERIP
jgi:O-acetylhomoserine (thiol)-lyase